ncbi:hypothetical protein LKD70_08450 [Ruminococcus sp. CLA-AA-H200]|uniref:ABC-2 family transporter protein n=1 Tax=Ruminococcus turbiniformis TaxID=2881258 RepID=A0ABS8FWN8_9FIRM|nr:hypothetical protein [Ruminococcus turbiniformis]MCC2254445.1 hypothetical protein [Ruminococcus turbiniformis]
MNFDSSINTYREALHLSPDEKKIQKTVAASVETFLLAESGKSLSRRSFLYIQLRLIRKRWWLLQAVLLSALWMFLPFAEREPYIYRTLGTAGTLFIILMIPELWKNRTNHCMEIEAAARYSLRHIYAARMLLFGLADVLILTAFLLVSTLFFRADLTALLTQFLFPTAVTACICFGTLSSSYPFGESAAVGICILWSGLWWCITLDDRLYSAVTVPVWCILLAMAFLLLAFAVRRSLCQCEKIWEKSETENITTKGEDRWN